MQKTAPPYLDNENRSERISMTEQPTISDELRGQLMMAWSLGFLDAWKGREVMNDEAIPTELGDALIVASEKTIKGSETFIAEVFMENPTMVYQTVYASGFEASININGITSPIEVNLN